MATLRAATTNGTITLNPISGILTRPDTYQTEGGDGGELDNTAGKKLMTYLAGRQASKYNADHGAPPSREYKGRP